MAKLAKARLAERERKTRVLQSDIPSYPPDQATKVGQALADHFALKPTRPLLVAQALNTQPTSGPFRMLCGASIAYGLTSGGYNAEEISLTPLGRRVVAPTTEGDDAMALREALLTPRVPREFLTRYDGSRVPREDIALNVLGEIGVPKDAAKRTIRLILEAARGVGFLREINGVPYVDLQGTRSSAAVQIGPELDAHDDTEEDDVVIPDRIPQVESPLTAEPLALHKKRSAGVKVFISHSKNMEVVSQIKTMLNVAEVEYEVAVEEEATAIPVPDKVLTAMRNCSAAVICVTCDSMHRDGETPVVNQNVLIEIGAAFVLYDKRVVLLWDKRVPVPSNLQGLYRCEFEGKELSWTVGMKLMEAVKKLKG